MKEEKKLRKLEHEDLITLMDGDVIELAPGPGKALLVNGDGYQTITVDCHEPEEEDEEYPIAYGECECGGTLEIYRYGDDCKCKECGLEYETDWCDHPEISGCHTEFWFMLKDN